VAVRLFVGNMPYGATEADLRSHFSGVAPPSQIVIPVDRETGRPRGFAFVGHTGILPGVMCGREGGNEFKSEVQARCGWKTIGENSLARFLSESLNRSQLSSDYIPVLTKIPRCANDCPAFAEIKRGEQ
jgi:hypothetical protein